MARDVIGDLDRKLAALGMPRRSSRRSRAPALPPLSARQMQEAEESLMAKSLNWLGYAGQTLSKGGAAVRGVTSGLTGGEFGGGLLNLIPFSDTMGLTTEKDKITGWDLLSQAGIEPAKKQKGLHPLDNPGDFAWDVASFGLDVATDPLTYVGGLGVLAKGAGVLSKAGKATKAAGLLDDAARVAAKTGAKGSAGVGRRVFNMTQTPRSAIELLPVGRRAAARKKFFTAATKGGTLKRSGARRVTDEAAEAMLDQPLGGLQRWNVPFTGLEYLPSGPVAQKIGGVLDKAGQAARLGRFSPAKGIARVFDQSVEGAKTSFMQKEAPFHGLGREAAEAQATAEVHDLLRPLWDTKALETEKGGDLISNLLESTTPEQVNASIRAIVGDPEFGKTATEGMLREVSEKFHQMNAANLAKSAVVGADPAELLGPIRHLTRSMSNKLLRKGSDSLGDTSRKVQPGRFGTQTPEEFGRKEFTHGLFTTQIKDLARDPRIEAMLVKGAEREKIAAKIKELHPKIPETYLTKDQNTKIAKRVAKQEGATEQVALKLQSEIDAITASPKDRHKALAKWLDELTPEIRKAGIFDVHPYNAILSSARHIKQSTATGEFLTKTLAAKDVMRPGGLQVADDLVGDALHERMKVRAADRGNIGKLVSRDKTTGEWLVRFRNPDTKVQKTVLLPAESLRGMRKVDPGKDKPLGELLTELGLKHEGALPQIAKGLGITDPRELSQLNKALVRKDIATDLLLKRSKIELPGLEAVRSLTNVWKPSVTGPVYRPAFPVRNRVGGRVRNILDGMDAWRMNSVARKVLRGQVDESGVLRGHVLVKDMARSRGIDPATLTNAQATDLFREVIRQADLLDRGQGDVVADVAGGLVDDSATGGAFFRPFPGGFQGRGESEGILKGLATALPQWAKRLSGMADDGTTWNPFAATFRGVHQLQKRGKHFGTAARDEAATGPIGQLFGDVAQETTFAPFKSGEQINRMVEGMNRLPPFLKLTAEGTDPLVAKRLVDAAQVAYANKNYTQAEQLLSLVIPFYKFSKGTAVHTAKELLDRPGGGLAQLIRAGERFRGEGIMPEHVAQGMAIPIPEGMLGIGPQPGGDDRYLAGLGLMHEDAFGMLGGGVQDTLADLLSRVNPLLKAPIEMASGKSFFMRGPGGPRDIEDLDPQISRIIANIKGIQEVDRTHSGIEQLLANSPLAPIAQTTRKLTGLLPRAGRRGSASFRAGKEALNLLSGARLTDVSEQQRDNIIRSLVDEAMRVEGARKFARRYVSKADRQAMSPQQRREVEKLMAIGRVLDQRRKGR